MRKDLNVKKLVLTSVLLSIVIILQLFASVIKIGVFEFSLVLIPITVGAIMLGPRVGALLGFIFGVVVLFQPGTTYFYSFGVIQTIIIVLLKGTCAGFLCGFIYQKINKLKYSTIIASFITPIINTSLFIIGTLTLLYPALDDMAGDSSILTLLLSFVGINFLVELIITIVLSPTLKRIITLNE